MTARLFSFLLLCGITSTIQGLGYRFLIDRDLIAKKDGFKFNFRNGRGKVRGMGFRSFGCWKDTWDRAIQPLEGKHELLMDANYKLREDPLRKCAIVALENHFKMFAIENGGQCLGDINAARFYQRFGIGDQCRDDGYGGPWSMQVYAFTGYELKRRHGRYTKWSLWTDCSKTCGKGIKIRTRSCIQPSPANGGMNCKRLGPSNETKPCQNDCSAKDTGSPPQSLSPITETFMTTPKESQKVKSLINSHQSTGSPSRKDEDDMGDDDDDDEKDDEDEDEDDNDDEDNVEITGSSKDHMKNGDNVGKFNDDKTKSGDDITKSNDDMTKSGDDITKAHDDITKSSDDLTKAHDDITKSNDDMTKSSDDLTKAHDDIAKSSDDLTKAHDDITKANDGVAKSSDDITKPTDDITKSSDDLTKAHDDITKAHDGVAKSSDDITKSTDDITKSSNDMTKPSDDITKSSNDMTKSSDDITKTSDDMTKSSDDITKAHDDIMKSTDGVAKSTDDVTKPANHVVKSTDDVTKSTDDMAESTDDVTISTHGVAKSTNDVTKAAEHVAKSTDNLATSTAPVTNDISKIDNGIFQFNDKSGNGIKTYSEDSTQANKINPAENTNISDDMKEKLWNNQLKAAHDILRARWLSLEKNRLEASPKQEEHGSSRQAVVEASLTDGDEPSHENDDDEDEEDIDDEKEEEKEEDKYEEKEEEISDKMEETGTKRITEECICPAVMCSHLADTGVLIDNSNVTDIDDLAEMKSFAKGLAAGFGTEEKDIQMGIIAAGRRSKLVVPFGETIPVHDLNRRVDGIRREKGPSTLGQAMKRAEAYLLAKQKKAIPPLLNDVVFVMVSGDSDVDVHAPLEDLKKGGAKVVVIGVGKNAKIGKIASQADKMFTVPPGTGNAMVNAIIAAVCTPDLMGKIGPNPKPCPCTAEPSKKRTSPEDSPNPAALALQTTDPITTKDDSKVSTEQPPPAIANQPTQELTKAKDADSLQAAPETVPAASATLADSPSATVPAASATLADSPSATVPATPPTTSSATPPATVPATPPATVPAHAPATSSATHTPATSSATPPATVPATSPATLTDSPAATVPATPPAISPATSPVNSPGSVPVSLPANTPAISQSVANPTKPSSDSPKPKANPARNNKSIHSTNKIKPLSKSLSDLSQSLNKAQSAGELKEGNFTLSSDIRNLLKNIVMLKKQAEDVKSSKNQSESKVYVGDESASQSLSSTESTDQSSNTTSISQSASITESNNQSALLTGDIPLNLRISDQTKPRLGEQSASNGKVNNQSKTTSTQMISQSKPSTEMISQSKPSTEMISQSKPSTEMISQSKPSTQMISQSKPSTEMISQSKPSTEMISQSKPSTEMISQSKPSTEMISQSKPSTEMISQSKPSTEMISQSKPNNAISQSKPSTEMISQSKPSTEMVNQSKPSTETISQSLPKPKIASQSKIAAPTSTNMPHHVKLAQPIAPQNQDVPQPNSNHKEGTAVQPSGKLQDTTLQQPAQSSTSKNVPLAKLITRVPLAQPISSVKGVPSKLLTNSIKGIPLAQPISSVKGVPSKLPTNSIKGVPLSVSSTTAQDAKLTKPTTISHYAPVSQPSNSNQNPTPKLKNTPPNAKLLTPSGISKDAKLSQPTDTVQDANPTPPKMTTQNAKPSPATSITQNANVSPVSHHSHDAVTHWPGSTVASTTHSKGDFLTIEKFLAKSAQTQMATTKSSIPDCDINLGFALDGSASVEGTKRGNFLKMINFVKDIIHTFVELSVQVHVGTLIYSTDTSVILTFGTKGTEEMIDRILDNIHYPGQGSRTGNALKDSWNQMFSRVPRGRRSVLLLLTDGPSNDDVKRPSEWIKGQKVEVFVIGLGKGYDEQQLNIIASEPADKHVMTKQFDELRSSVQEVRNRICGFNANEILQIINRPGYRNDADINAAQKRFKPNQCILDVAFLLDGSRQVETNGEGNFQRQINFIKKAAKFLPLSRDDVHIGVGLLGDSEVMVFPANEHYTEDAIDYELDHIHYPASSVIQPRDLISARDIMLQKGIRDVAPHVFVLLTDVSSLDSYRRAIKDMETDGSDVVMLGIGTFSWKQEVKVRSSVEGLVDQVVTIENVDETEAVKQLADNLCKLSNAKRAEIPRRHWKYSQKVLNANP